MLRIFTFEVKSKLNFMKIIFILCSTFLFFSCNENVNLEKSKLPTIELNLPENEGV